MNASSMKKLVHMHTLKAEIRNRQRKSGRTLQRMEMLREQFAESGNPYWNGVCERIAARNENMEEAA